MALEILEGRLDGVRLFDRVAERPLKRRNFSLKVLFARHGNRAARTLLTHLAHYGILESSLAGFRGGRCAQA